MESIDFAISTSDSADGGVCTFETYNDVVENWLENQVGAYAWEEYQGERGLQVETRYADDLTRQAIAEGFRTY